MIRRHKATIFTDAKESTTVYELKRIVEGILKRPPEDQRLYKVRRSRFPPAPAARAGARDAVISPAQKRSLRTLFTVLYR